MKIIAGFPGVGKSSVFKKYKDRVSDSDSSKFPKGDFPQNYIKHIKEESTRKDIVLVSSHDVVRKALLEANIPFTLVYPALECKAEYLKRYKDRGSPKAFLELLDKNWDKWIQECEDQKGCKKIVLKPGEFLADVVTL
jgi:broad-specificity NMP kinase